MSVRVRTAVRLAAVAISIALPASAGHPPWPPPRHSAEYRQANMVFLRFQDAIAAERWAEALSMCSARVRAEAAAWQMPAAFFAGTVPVENLLSQDFGYWTTRSNFFGLFVPLSAPGSEPPINWFWAIAFTNSAWVVDYPPSRLDAYVAAKKEAFEARDRELRRIRQALEPKLRDLRTRLVPVTGRFVIGSPMLFRIELVNSGDAPVQYMDAGIGHHPLVLSNETGEVIASREEPAQRAVRRGEAAAHSSTVLADGIDICRDHAITRPGKYFVRFDGTGLDIGEPVPIREPGAFGEDEGAWSSGFVPALHKFPSDVVEFEVTGGAGK